MNFPIYLEDWAISNKKYEWSKVGLEGIKDDFQIKDEDLEGIEILLAYYSYEDYSGDAFVLFRKDGKLYEVNGGHCSCYGLEGQWSPEEVLLEEMHNRVTNGTYGYDYYGGDGYKKELKEIVEYLMEEGK